MKIIIRLFQVLRLIVIIPIIVVLILVSLIEWIIKGKSKLKKWVDYDLSEIILKPFDND